MGIDACYGCDCFDDPGAGMSGGSLYHRFLRVRRKAISIYFGYLRVENGRARPMAAVVENENAVCYGRQAAWERDLLEPSEP